MSFGSYIPPTSSDDVGALLEILGRPAEAKKLLQELADEKKALDAATAKYQKQRAEGEAQANELKAENENIKAEADAAATKATIERGTAERILKRVQEKEEEGKRAERKMADMRIALEEREQRLNGRDKDITARSLAIDEDNGKLAQQKKQLDVREQALAAREQALDLDIAELNNWVKNIKPPPRRT